MVGYMVGIRSGKDTLVSDTIVRTELDRPQDTSHPRPGLATHVADGSCILSVQCAFDQSSPVDDGLMKTWAQSALVDTGMEEAL